MIKKCIGVIVVSLGCVWGSASAATASLLPDDDATLVQIARFVVYEEIGVLLCGRDGSADEIGSFSRDHVFKQIEERGIFWTAAGLRGPLFARLTEKVIATMAILAFMLLGTRVNVVALRDYKRKHIADLLKILAGVTPYLVGLYKELGLHADESVLLRSVLSMPTSGRDEGGPLLWMAGVMNSSALAGKKCAVVVDSDGSFKFNIGDSA